MKNNLILLSLILVLTSVSFLPSLNNGFTNYDDNIYVVENKLITDFSVDNLKKIFFSPFYRLYHPLVFVSHLFEYRLFGLNPKIYHFDNFLLHLLNTAFVFWFILLISNSSSVTAFITAIFFGIHPIHVESVAWLSSRKDVLFSVFYLASLISFLYYKNRQNRNYYYLSLFFFFLSLLSKSMAITLPVILLLIDYFLARKITKQDLTANLPFFLISFIFGIITVIFHYTGQHSPDKTAFNFFGNLVSAGSGLFFYLSKILYPVKLSCIYPLSEKLCAGYVNPSALPVIISLILLVSVFFINNKNLRFGTFFFLITVLPVIQLLPAGQQIPADRYIYLPSLGVFFLAASLISTIYSLRMKYLGVLKIALASIFIIIVGILSLLTYNRCKVWKDDLTLWNDVLRNYKNIPRAYRNRAEAYTQKKIYDKALIDYDTAIAFKPQNLDAYYNSRGNFFNKTGEFDKAIEDYDRAINIAPQDSNLLLNRGIAYENRKKYSKAIADYTKALNLDPNNAQALNNRGVVMGKLGNYEKSIDDLNKAIIINPSLKEAYVNRALAFFAVKKYEKSLADVKRLESTKYSVDSRFLKALKSATNKIKKP